MRLHGPAERRKETLQQIAVARRGQRRDDDLQRDRRRRELRPLARDAGHRRAERLVERDRKEGRRRIGTVVDILIATPFGAAATAHQSDRVEIEDQRCLAALRIGLREKHGSTSKGQLDFMGAIGMLHQQKAEIGGRLMRGGDGQIHGGYRVCSVMTFGADAYSRRASTCLG